MKNYFNLWFIQTISNIAKNFFKIFLIELKNILCNK